ncbi:MAG: DUF6755 family protein [Acidobacteriota bacterium]
MKRSLSRQQKLTIVNGILAIVGVITLLQLWLLSATMNAFLGGGSGVIIPAGIASVACLLLNLGLLWNLYRLERP